MTSKFHNYQSGSVVCSLELLMGGDFEILWSDIILLNYRNKNNIAKNTEDIELLKAIVKELEQKSVEQDEAVSDLKATTESTSINVSLNHRTFMEKCDDF